MPVFQIWSEGYKATGESGGAHRHGKAEGESFKEACCSFASKDSDFATYFDESGMTYWGCKLFDNEVDARKLYG